MATTTNYGWTTPDDTGLVKDGASAIRSLGTAIDTTTKNLNPQTTTGAIAYRSATANVNTSLPIGTAGQVLKVNSGATAPEWGAVASGLTYITGATFTGAATVSFASGVFTSTYQNYLVVFNFTASSANQNISLRVNNAGSARTAANYYGNKVHNATATVTTGGTSFNASAINSTNAASSLKIFVDDPLNSGVKTTWNLIGVGQPDGGGTGIGPIAGGGTYDVAEANDGLTILVGGTITGNYRVYGIANS